MIISCNLISDVGLKRSNNEDIVLLNGDFYRDNAYQSTFTLNDNARMAATVADGMGGHAGGEFASELAAQSFQTFVETLPATVDTATLHNLIKSWATDAHYMIKRKGEEIDPTIPSNIIYNALGVGDSVFADVEDITQKVIPGDKFIICSDGLSDMADDETIESVMENGGSAPELVAAAKEAGGKDNVSVIVVEIIE